MIPLSGLSSNIEIFGKVLSVKQVGVKSKKILASNLKLQHLV